MSDLYRKDRLESMVVIIAVVFSVTAMVIPLNMPRALAGTPVSGIVYDGAGGPWALAGSPYLVEGHVTVPAGETLTIEEGVEVKFNSALRLYIDGTLNAVGAGNNMIKFTSNITPPSPGDWGGIWINSTGHGEIRFCNITYASFGISTDSSNNNITDSYMSDNFQGIHLNSFSDSNNIERNHIWGNIQGISMDWAENNKIINNNISLNSNIGITLQGEYTTVRNNEISQNGGIGVLVFWANNSVIFNNVTLNAGAGISIDSMIPPPPTGNILYHNNIIGNSPQAIDASGLLENLWNDTYSLSPLRGGNCWSDFSPGCVDNYNGPNQDILGADGICDFNYTIDADSISYYPLKNPEPKAGPIIINTPPELSGGQVFPPTGDPGVTAFTYNVTYRDADNDPPASYKVNINKSGTPITGSPFLMTPGNWFGAIGDYVAGRNYTYTTSLADCGSDYTYAFSASDGIVKVFLGDQSGPIVSCALTIAISYPNNTQNWTGGSGHYIWWNMTDDIDPDQDLIIYLNYTSSAGSGTIAGPLIGLTDPSSYFWNPLPLIDAADVVVNATVIDTDGNQNWSEAFVPIIDSLKPTVTDTVPVDSAIGTVVTTNVDVTWSEGMNQVSTESAFTLYKVSDWSTVSGIWLPWVGNTMTFNPSADLELCTIYQANITTMAKDDSDPGNTLASEFTFGFTTSCRPSIKLSYPENTQDWTGGSGHNIWWNMSDDVTPDPSLIIYLNYTSSAGSGVISGPLVGLTDPSTYLWDPLPFIDAAGVVVNATVIDTDGLVNWSEALVPVIDSTKPTVIGTDPLDGASEVSILTDVVVTFSESMNTASGEGSFSLNDTSLPGWPSVAGMFSWDTTNTTLTFKPSAPLNLYTEYSVNITCDALDDSDSGNTLDSTPYVCPEPYNFNFNTSIIGIRVESPNGNEDWSGGTIHDIEYTITGGTPPYAVWLNYSTSSDSPPWIFIDTDEASPYPWTTPTVDFCTVRINATVVDSNGYASFDISNADFCIDSTPPTVSSTVPMDTATDVPITTNIKVTWSEGMNQATTQSAFTLHKVSDGLVVSGIWLPWSGNTMTFDPSADLELCTVYQANITTSAEDDSDPGNNLASVFAFSFTTTCRPVIEFSYPDNAQDWTGGSGHYIWWNMTDDVDPDPDLIVYLNYTSSVGSGTIAGPLIGLTEPSSYFWNPLPLIDATDVIVNATIIDTAGLMSWDEVLIPIIDSTNPTITVKEPEDSAANVAVTTNIEVAWSEGMNQLSAQSAFTLYKVSDGSVVSGIWLSWLGNTMTFDPAGDLAGGTQYQVNITTLAKDDSEPGNSMASEYSWTFTTKAPDTITPTVDLTIPGDQASGVAIDTTITVAFSEDMKKASVESAISISHGLLPIAFSWPDNKTVTFSPSSALDYGTTYTVVVGIGAKDLAGNNLQSQYDWSFTTEGLGTITGRVIYKDGTPTENAKIELVKEGQTIATKYTDADGNFQFDNVSPGDYVIRVTNAGYEDYISSSFSVVTDETKDLGDIQLIKLPKVAEFPWQWLLVPIIVAILLILIFTLWRRRKKKPAEATPLEPSSPSPSEASSEPQPREPSDGGNAK